MTDDTTTESDPTSGEVAIPEIGYAAAMAELEAILEEIERDDVDIDVLAEKVRRASELIRSCRHRLQGARVEVEQIVAEMDGVSAVNP